MDGVPTAGVASVQLALAKARSLYEIEPHELDGLAGCWDAGLHDHSGNAAIKPFTLIGTCILTLRS